MYLVLLQPSGFRGKPEIGELEMSIRSRLGRMGSLLAAAVVLGGAGVVGMAGAASAAPASAGPPALAPLRGCAIKTVNGHYLTAVDGGGRITDVLHTNATIVQSWEKFALVDTGTGGSIHYYGIRTVNGHYLTAVGAGGRSTDVIHSDATQLQNWEKFRFNPLGGDVYDIQTYNGHFLTAVDGGNRITDTIHSDAIRVGSWERFTVVCGY
jgi:hypothetical protein